jgi:hypothetical protein
MADIFTSLAEQTLGLSTVVQPLAASRFGPTPTIAVDMPFRFADEQGPVLPPASAEAAASEASDWPLPLISPDDPRVAAPLPTFRQMIQSVVAAQDEPGPDVIQPPPISVAHLSAARGEPVALPDAPPAVDSEPQLDSSPQADTATREQAAELPPQDAAPRSRLAEPKAHETGRAAGHWTRVVQPAIPKSATPPAYLPSVSPVSPAMGNVVQLQAAPASVTPDASPSQPDLTSVAVIQPNGLTGGLPVSPSVKQAKATPPTDLKSNAPPAIHAPRNSRRRTAAPADMASEPASRRQPIAPTPKPSALPATDLQAETMVQVGGQTVEAHLIPLAHETRVEAAMHPQPQAPLVPETPDSSIRREAVHASISSDAAIPLPPDHSIVPLASPVEAQVERVIRPAIPKNATPPAYLPSVSPVSPAMGNVVQLQAAPASVTADTPPSQPHATSVAVVQSNGLTGGLPVSPSVNQAKAAPSTDLKSNAPPAIHAPRNSRRRTAAPADMASEPASRRQPDVLTPKPSALTATDLQVETKVAGQTEAARIVPLAHETRAEVEAQVAVVQPNGLTGGLLVSPSVNQAKATPPARLPSESPTRPAMGNVVQSQTTFADIAPGALASLAQTISSTRPPRATATSLQQNAKSSQEDEKPIAPRLDPAALSGSAWTQSMTARRLPPVVSEALPTIRVTIGRIEVRTTPAPSTPVAPRSRPAQPALSLKEYLKQGQSKKS